MSVPHLFITIALLAVVWNVVSSILIYEALRKRGQKVSFLWLRLMIPAYAVRYRKLTIAETGRTGPLFYHWIISINTALVAVIAAIVTLSF